MYSLLNDGTDNMLMKLPPSQAKYWTVESMVGPFTHQVAKGDSTQLLKEALTATVGTVEVDDEVWNHVMDKFFAHYRGGQSTFDEFLAMKNKSANPGYPWVNLYESFDKLLLAKGAGELESFLQFVWGLILSGQGPQTVFRVHSKLDKYNPIKLATERFRAIYAPDWVLLALMHKYGFAAVDNVEMNVPEVVVIISGALWKERVEDPFHDKETVDVDYTAYDKSIPGPIVYRFIEEFYLRAGAPPLMASWIAWQVAYALLVLPTGELVLRVGGNPSGQFLTTILNSFWSLYGWKKSSKEVLGGDSWKNMLLRVAGDDAVVPVNTPVGIPFEDYDAVREGLRYYANQKAKTSFFDGDKPFPPGFHAPFLGRVSTTVDGVLITFPLQPGRNLARVQQRPGGGPDQNYAVTLAGVRQSLAGFVALARLGRAIPGDVARALEYIYLWKEEHPHLDWSCWVSDPNLCEGHVGWLVPEATGGG